MGLDMYLYKRTYIGANFEHRNVTGTVEVKVAGNPIPITFNRISEIIERVGYWRKANQIHNWFVENVQEGVDDCGEYHVSRDKLNILLDDCIRIKESKDLAPELLPTASGFFFGGTEYGEWYWNDIDYTINLIKEVVAEPEHGDFYYSSSW